MTGRSRPLTTVEEANNFATTFQDAGELVAVFDGTEESLAALPPAALVAVWNAYSDRTVKKFASREAGVRRLAPLLRETFGVAPLSVEASTSEDRNAGRRHNPRRTGSRRCRADCSRVRTEAGARGNHQAVARDVQIGRRHQARGALGALQEDDQADGHGVFVKAGGNLARLRADMRRGVVEIQPPL
jgi:hypothetical protein